MRSLTSQEHPVEPEPERLAVLALIPALATGLYYFLPPRLQGLPTTQFIPQVLAYVTFGLWIIRNQGVIERLGLQIEKLRQGAMWGLAVGLALGTLNSWVILWVVPWLGADIEFLRETPHARMPLLLMVPWIIVLIAVFVELNFRGFQLGRWLAFCSHPKMPAAGTIAPLVAVGTSSVIFAFDPFMVSTFKHLHWIAIWDGVVWGTLWLRLRSLYATIVAHAVEVVLMYSIVRGALT
jgi:hypothetical protein